MEATLQSPALSFTEVCRVLRRHEAEMMDAIFPLVSSLIPFRALIGHCGIQVLSDQLVPDGSPPLGALVTQIHGYT